MSAKNNPRNSLRKLSDGREQSIDVIARLTGAAVGIQSVLRLQVASAWFDRRTPT